MKLSDNSLVGRFATRMAVLLAPPFTGRFFLADMNKRGYVDPEAIIDHKNLQLGSNIFIGDRVVIRQSKGGGRIEIGDRVHILRDTIMVSGKGGRISIGKDTYIQPACFIMSYLEEIKIGNKVQIGPRCGFYSYDHGVEDEEMISNQPLKSKGKIEIDDDAWIGYGVIVLSGVTIGKGAVIGAGAVVSRNIPEGAIAAGVPAKVIGMRKNKHR